VIKGVNRHVIEVTETENEYYERALLVVKPEYASVERELLEKEARKVLKELGAPSAIRRRNRFLYWAVRLTPAAVAGAGVAAAALLL
jgi:hypothetical protein